METPACQLIEINISEICKTLSSCVSHSVDKEYMKKLILNQEKSRPLIGSFIKSEHGVVLGTIKSILDVDGLPHASVSIIDGVDVNKILLYPRVKIEANNLVIINIDANYF